MFRNVLRSLQATFSCRFEAKRSSIGCLEVTLSRLEYGGRTNRGTLLCDDLDLGEWEANSVLLSASERVCL